jgi:hypothetical protein
MDRHQVLELNRGSLVERADALAVRRVRRVAEIAFPRHAFVTAAVAP